MSLETYKIGRTLPRHKAYRSNEEKTERCQVCRPFDVLMYNPGAWKRHVSIEIFRLCSGEMQLTNI